MENHVRIIGALNIAQGVLGALAGLIILLVFGGAATVVGVAGHQDPDARAAMSIIGLVGATIAMFLLVIALPSLIAGIGLLQLRPWARVLTIILSVINLFHFPLGTFLGAYGLWVLIPEETARLFSTQSSSGAAAGEW